MKDRKEIYRSFDGKLGVDQQYGYVVEEGKNFYYIEVLSVWSDETDQIFRIPKTLLLICLWRGFRKFSEICIIGRIFFVIWKSWKSMTAV